MKVGLDIAMVVPGLPFDGNSVNKKSLGGSESAAYYMARELALLGHHVRLFCNCDGPDCSPGTYDGVQYFRLSEWEDFCRYVPHDISIVQRAPVMFAAPHRSRLNWLWCHDMALGRQRAEILGCLWNVDKILVLSAHMKQQYQELYGVADAALMQTRNGIALHQFGGLDNVKRHRNRLVYSARPERGVDNLLKSIFPMLLKEDPNLELHLCGYDNATEQLAAFYAEVNALISSYGNRVVWHGHLTKRALYELYASSGVYVYPTPSPIQPTFVETSCITMMEAQACGLPVVATNRGALKETVASGTGTLVDGDPQSAEYRQAFVAAVLQLVRDDGVWQAASAAGRENAKNLSWAAVAKQWTEEAEKQIRELSSNTDTLAHHFWRRSDIQAARHLIATHPEAVSKSLVDVIETDWAFTANDVTYREQYERIGATHGPNIGHEVHEPRFNILESWLRQNPKCDRIMDYGCAYGNYLLNMAPRFPERQWLGVDIDKNSIELASKHRERLGISPAHVRLTTVESLREGPEDRRGWNTLTFPGEKEGIGKKANCLILFEVLEHVMDPTALIKHVEQFVEPGGKIVITVPYGPWEYSSYDTYPHRCHLWEFDWHDLRDIFGEKKGLSIGPVLGGISPELGEPLGWWLVEYTVDSTAPTGTVDLDRKSWLQRPRQTVSATSLVGPDSEDNLHWCLKSMRHVADEVVLVDCGASDEAKRIIDLYAKQYRGALKLVPGVDPKQEGFETPRNMGLAHCTKDWVLWLDTDEKLLGSEATHKYLRQNQYNGYCIRQVHFACDTTFTPDSPVRLFRRLWEGKPVIRWYGMIHEHPELKMNEGPGQVITIADVWVPHVGYLNEKIRRGRFARNYPLLMRDMEKYPDRVLQKHFLIRDKMMLCAHELQQNGGRLTQEIQDRCNEVIELYRKHFRGKASYSGVDTLQYYSQACQLLGLGTEVAFQVASAKTGKPEVNGTKFYRFATMEDLEAELLQAARASAEPLMAKEW